MAADVFQALKFRIILEAKVTVWSTSEFLICGTLPHCLYRNIAYYCVFIFTCDVTHFQNISYPIQANGK